MTNKRWILASRPQGQALEGCFRWDSTDLPPLADGDVRVRILWLSLDPTNRIWMNDADSYMPRLELGAVMRGIGLGVVEESRAPGFFPGDMIQGLLGWQRYYQGPAAGIAKVPPLAIPLEAHFGLLGHIGFTAYFGLLDIGQPKAGETLVVSAAAGAVGSLAGQIGKILGLRVVGIAGGPEKCRYIVEELGFDAAIDYKSENLWTALPAACPQGVDIDFENVGGKVLEAVLGHLNIGARVALCGLIAGYNADRPEPGPSTLGMLLIRRARMQGFIVTDYAARFPEAAAKLLEWHGSGKLKYRLDVVEGLEQAPGALQRLFTGANTGKLVVRVSEEMPA
jgi:hypothetical protein